MVGNPNHDPRTGKFTSASGLNKANSTITQRGKARVKEHISGAKAFAIGAAAAGVGAVGAALLQGVTRPVRVHSTILANKAITAGIEKAEHLVATHGPTIAKAIATKGSSLAAHVKNMKIAGKSQHNVSSISSKTSTFKSPGQLKSETSAVLNRARTVRPTMRVKAPTRRV
jgi:hypothetical protein